MLSIDQFIISTLANDPVLASLMGTTTPNSLVYFGPVDVVQETQASLQYPLVMVNTVSESMERMPLNAKEVVLQIDMMSRTSQLEVTNINDQVENLLAYASGLNNNTKIWWMRTPSGADVSESEMRIWHKRLDLRVWAYGPPLTT